MPHHVLGISCFYHDSAAALTCDDRILAAAQEERFSRRKHDSDFPARAIDYCLNAGRVDSADLDAVVFYDNPALTLERNLASFVAIAPRGRERWREFAEVFLSKKLLVAREIRRRLDTRAPIYFSRHHSSHAASAYYPSPFDDAAILTIDGVGEWETASIAHGRGAAIEAIESIRFPHSLGLLYSAFTYFCGFRVNGGEYKLMGLAPYGTPRFADTIREYLIHLEPDGSFRLGLDYFGILEGERLTNARFEALFGGPPRTPESRITRRETDLAASIQVVTQEAVLGLARHAHAITHSENLCLAGGVALNCVANGLLRREGPFERVWIQPAAGDAGGALGAALLGAHVLLSVPRRPPTDARDGQRGSLLGPRASAETLRADLDAHGHAYEVIQDRGARAQRVAEHLVAGDVVGVCSGRMEFGPRALGSRSILADPRRADTQTRLNMKVKFRESFRPFAPAVLEEACADYFELEGASPYMLMTAPVRADRRLPVERDRLDADDPDLLAIVRQPRSDVPAITHVDYSARLQTVGRDSNPDLLAILAAFRAITGCPMLVNTSFNVRGEPIVCTPQDAWSCFCRTDIDVLVVDDLVITGKPARDRQTEGDRGRSDWPDEAPSRSPSRGDTRTDLFFRLMLEPLAAGGTAELASLLGPERARGSAYQPAQADAELMELETLDAIGEVLRRRWSARGLDQACALIQPLLELSEELIDACDDTELGRVTPYIYTLF